MARAISARTPEPAHDGDAQNGGHVAGVEHPAGLVDQDRSR